jgi:sortase A
MGEPRSDKVYVPERGGNPAHPTSVAGNSTPVRPAPTANTSTSARPVSDAERHTAADLARTKLANVYEQSEKDAEKNRPFDEKPTARTKAEVEKIIDETPADKIPKLDADEAFYVKKSSLDNYHKAWQKYYQQYYEQYYSHNLKKSVGEIEDYAKRKNKVRKISRALTHAATRKRIPESEKTATRRLRHEVVYRAKKAGRKVKNSRHFKPILMGALAAFLVIAIQFNQLLTGAVAAFIAPSDTLSQSLLVATVENQPVTAAENNLLVIPKLGLESPLVFDAASTAESDMQAALERGVVWYDLPGAHAKPGEEGNAVFLGHSSADIFYGGEFKFIFSKLNRLSVGDTYYINYNMKRYIYQVDHIDIIDPTQLDKLYINDGTPWSTLVTCDPPGSSVHRRVVYAKQISPDPKTGSTPSKTDDKTAAPKNITGKTPTLFERIFGY